jgi:hypothetical protein
MARSILFEGVSPGLPLLVALGLWGQAQSAQAHGARIQAREATSVEIEATYDSGEPMAEAGVEVYDPTDPQTPRFIGTTDGEGRFSFTPDQSGRLGSDGAAGGPRGDRRHSRLRGWHRHRCRSRPLPLNPCYSGGNGRGRDLGLCGYSVIFLAGQALVHIPDGIIPAQVCAGGYALTGLTTWYVLRQIRRGPDPSEEVPKAALLAAAFFIGSSINIPVPPVSVHLVLNGLLGALLGWYAWPAILIGLFLQALLIGHGGLTTLGVNAVMMGVPALMAWGIFQLRYPLSDRLPCPGPWGSLVSGRGFGARNGSPGLFWGGSLYDSRRIYPGHRAQCPGGTDVGPYPLDAYRRWLYHPAGAVFASSQA